MSTFKLTTNPDSNNPVKYDLHLEGGKAAIVKGQEAIAQRALVRFSFLLGEWFADEREGTPWFQVIFPNANNPAIIRSTLRRVALSVPGIVSVEDVILDIGNESRSLSGVIEAKGDEGEPLRIGFSGDFLI